MLYVKVVGIKKILIIFLGAFIVFTLSMSYTSLIVGYVEAAYDFFEGPIPKPKIIDKASLTIYTSYLPIHIAYSVELIDPHSFPAVITLATANNIPIVILGLNKKGYEFLNIEEGNIVLGKELARRLGIGEGDLLLITSSVSKKSTVISIDSVRVLNGRLNEVLIVPLELAQYIQGRPNNIISVTYINNLSIVNVLNKEFKVNLVTPYNGIIKIFCSDGSLLKEIKVSAGRNIIKLPYGYYTFIYTVNNTQLTKQVLISRNLSIDFSDVIIRNLYSLIVYDREALAYVNNEVIYGNLTSYGKVFTLPPGLITVYAFGTNYTIYLDRDYVLHPLTITKGLPTKINAKWFDGRLFNGTLYVLKNNTVLMIAEIINGFKIINLPPGNYIFKLISNGVSVEVEGNAGSTINFLIPPPKPVRRVSPSLITRASMPGRIIDKVLTMILGMGSEIVISLVIVLITLTSILPWFLGKTLIYSLRKEITILKYMYIPKRMLVFLIVVPTLSVTLIAYVTSLVIQLWLSNINLNLYFGAFKVSLNFFAGVIYGLITMVLLLFSEMFYLRKVLVKEGV